MNGKIYNNDIFSVNIVSGPSKVLDTVIERTETRRFQFAASHEVRILWFRKLREHLYNARCTSGLNRASYYDWNTACQSSNDSPLSSGYHETTSTVGAFSSKEVHSHTTQSLPDIWIWVLLLIRSLHSLMERRKKRRSLQPKVHSRYQRIVKIWSHAISHAMSHLIHRDISRS